MLHFFRRYQKLFFVVVTVIIVISFVFFGTFSTLTVGEQAPDKTVATALDGSPITERTLSGMVRLLETGGGSYPNLLNDEIVIRDFLETGMGLMLAERAFAQIRPELQERLDKIKRFKPYVHAQTPYISSVAVWERYAPSLLQRLRALQASQLEATPEVLAQLIALFLDERRFPPDRLRRVLTFQQSQFTWINPDPLLYQSNLSLFGFETMEDWFGPTFLDLIARFILNAALVAEQRGYRVSVEEAHADLFQNALNGFVALTEKSPISYSEVGQYVEAELRALHLNESLAARLWQRALLFRRLFDEAGGGVFLDATAYAQFDAYAQERVLIDLYQLPRALRLADFSSLLRLQTYLDAVAPPQGRGGDLLALPKVFLSPEAVEKRYPELVVHRFALEWSGVDKEEVAQRISVRETWDWELEDAHWQLVQRAFPALNRPAATREERFRLLDKMEPSARFKVDQFARSHIVDSHPEWIREALDRAEPHAEEVAVRLRGGTLPFAGVQRVQEFLQLLYDAQADAVLQCFSEDGTHYYKIRVVQRPSAKQILTFAEASADGSLGGLLDKRLEEAYSEAKKKDPAPFQRPDGSWKPLHDVRDQVGAYLYADVLKAIAGKEKSPSYDFYATHRFYAYMQEAAERLHAQPDDPQWIAKEGGQESLANQWLLMREEVEVARSQAGRKSAAFTLTDGAWSIVTAPPNGDLFFFRKVRRVQAPPRVRDQMEQGQRALSVDARRALTDQLLKREGM
jgi:GcvH upstream region-like protein